MSERRFIQPDTPEWPGFLARARHDFYHTPQYCRLEARRAGGRARAFFFTNDFGSFLLPLIVCQIPDTNRFDARSPYGYPGPLTAVLGEIDNCRFLESACSALRNQLEEEGIVSAFVRLHPVLRLPAEPLTRVGAVVHHGQTVAINLCLPPEQQWRQLRNDHRTQIRKATKAGFEARLDRNLDTLADFVDIYQETMQRVGAAREYLYPLDYFRDLLDGLPDSMNLIVVEKENEVACAGLFSSTGDISQFHLSGTREKFLANRPSKLMIDFARQWATRQGLRVLHLGGGLGGRDDSLFEFKRGFSKTRLEFSTWRIVADDAAYEELIQRRKALGGTLADEGFFPEYRAPLAASQPG